MSNHVHDEKDGYDENEDHIFTMTDVDGVEHEMIIVFTFELDEQFYAVLLDRNHPEEDGVIFRIEEDEEEGDYLTSIDSEEEWSRAAQMYEQLVSEQT